MEKNGEIKSILYLLPNLSFKQQVRYKGLGKIIRVRSWKEFKKRAISLHPKSIVYNLQRSPLSTPPISLRLVFTFKQNQYVFLDFAKGNTLRQTKVPITKPENGEAYIRDEDVKKFITTELMRNDILIVAPVWQLEYQ